MCERWWAPIKDVAGNTLYGGASGSSELSMDVPSLDAVAPFGDDAPGNDTHATKTKQQVFQRKHGETPLPFWLTIDSEKQAVFMNRKLLLPVAIDVEASEASQS